MTFVLTLYISLTTYFYFRSLYKLSSKEQNTQKKEVNGPENKNAETVEVSEDFSTFDFDSNIIPVFLEKNYKIISYCFHHIVNFISSDYFLDIILPLSAILLIPVVANNILPEIMETVNRWMDKQMDSLYNSFNQQDNFAKEISDSDSLSDKSLSSKNSVLDLNSLSSSGNISESKTIEFDIAGDDVIAELLGTKGQKSGDTIIKEFLEEEFAIPKNQQIDTMQVQQESSHLSSKTISSSFDESEILPNATIEKIAKETICREQIKTNTNTITQTTNISSVFNIDTEEEVIIDIDFSGKDLVEGVINSWGLVIKESSLVSVPKRGIYRDYNFFNYPGRILLSPVLDSNGVWERTLNGGYLVDRYRSTREDFISQMSAWYRKILSTYIRSDPSLAKLAGSEYTRIRDAGLMLPDDDYLDRICISNEDIEILATYYSDFKKK